MKKMFLVLVMAASLMLPGFAMDQGYNQRQQQEMYNQQRESEHWEEMNQMQNDFYQERQQLDDLPAVTPPCQDVGYNSHNERHSHAT